MINDHTGHKREHNDSDKRCNSLHIIECKVAVHACKKEINYIVKKPRFKTIIRYTTYNGEAQSGYNAVLLLQPCGAVAEDDRTHGVVE